MVIIMMHAHSVHPHKLRKNLFLTVDTVAYIRSLIYSVTSRATRFVVSVPA
jgi:hypothetical protein